MQTEVQSISIHEQADRSAARSFREGVADCVPTLLGYLSIGFAAGVVEKTSGLSVTEIILLSVFLYAGSAQFIVAGLVAAGASVLSIIFTILFVNLRHLLLSAAISPYFRGYSPARNALLGSQLTDETFGVAINRLPDKGKHRDYWMLGLNITAHANWVAANIAGAYFGAWIPDPKAYGLDYAMPAMFVGLLVMQIASRKKLPVDLLVMVGAFVFFIGAFRLLPGNVAVITATILAAAIGMVAEKWK